MRKVLYILFFSVLLVGCGGNVVDNDNSGIKEESEKDNRSEAEGNFKPAVKSEGEKEILDKGDSEENTFKLIPLDEFITNYNNLASLTDELKPLTDSAPKDGNNTQILLNDETYAILAIFDDNDDSVFYSVGLTQGDSYEKMEGNGLYATLNVAAALDLDFKKLTDELESTLEKESHTYFDNGHMIIIENHKVSGKSGLGMLVQFMKFVDED